MTHYVDGCEDRDRVNEKAMADPRLKDMMDPKPLVEMPAR